MSVVDLDEEEVTMLLAALGAHRRYFWTLVSNSKTEQTRGRHMVQAMKVRLLMQKIRDERR